MRQVECMREFNVESYLQDRQKAIDEEASVVKDFRVFDFNHVPPQPLLREECQTLIDILLRFEVSGIPTHMAIIGSRGSGKTLSLKFLAELLRQKTKLALRYVNCREHNTSFKVLAHLLGVQARGASLTELFERFHGESGDRTILILDEVDLMSQKDRRREILYLLSRSDKPFMVIMLSNNPHVVNQLDAATRSSLQPQIMHFRNYNAEQMLAILSDRAQRGLYQWEEPLLAEIAALTVKNTNADTRIAIKTLFYCMTEAKHDVGECFERARRDIVVDLVNDLSEANLTILCAAAQCRTDFAKEIYAGYCGLSQKRREKPFSYVYFYSNLSYLQSVGLIALTSVKIERTYTNRVVLTFDPSILEPVWRARMS